MSAIVSAREKLANNEPIFGLTPIRLAVWQAVSELERERPSLEEIAVRAGVARSNAGRAMEWLRNQQKVTWKNTRRSYEVLKRAPKQRSN
jgi:hypothetical protein